MSLKQDLSFGMMKIAAETYLGMLKEIIEMLEKEDKSLYEKASKIIKREK